MRLRDVEAILRALNDAEVQYLIVGGLAVVAHGYVRYTADVDLDLKTENVLRAITALQRIGYQPLTPVDPLQFADEQIRNRWREEKGMLVFQVINSDRPDTRIDLFVTEPFDFQQEFAAAERQDVAGIPAPVLRLETLIAMKKQVGRGQDLLDVAELTKISENRKT
jgi:predicted nucleotidyltransferase